MNPYTFDQEGLKLYLDAIHYFEKDFTVLEANDQLMGSQRKMDVNTHALVDKICDMIDRVKSCTLTDLNDVLGLRMTLVYYQNSVENVITITGTVNGYNFNPSDLHNVVAQTRKHIKKIDSHLGGNNFNL